MARVTVEDCLEQVGNHFALVILAARRAKEIYSAAHSLSTEEHRPTVMALKEVAEGKVRFEESIQHRLEEYLQELRMKGAQAESPLPELETVSA